MSAIDSCRTVAILRRCSPTLRVIQHEERHQREREQRELPVEQEHRDHDRDHRRHGRHHRGRGRGEDVVDAADVVRDPALHLAGARLREEREREPLQVPVDRGAQVVHHALADLRRDVRLHDAERAGDERDQRSSRRRAASAAACDVAGRTGRIAVSRMPRSRNGETTPRPTRRRSAPQTTIELRAQYGRKRRPIRRQVRAADRRVGRALEASRAATNGARGLRASRKRYSLGSAGLCERGRALGGG